MMLRIRRYNEEENEYKILSCVYLKDSDSSEMFKILEFMRKEHISLFINNEGRGDSTTCEECLIDYVNIEFPSISLAEDSKTCECITVDVI